MSRGRTSIARELHLGRNNTVPAGRKANALYKTNSALVTTTILSRPLNCVPDALRLLENRVDICDTCISAHGFSMRLPDTFPPGDNPTMCPVTHFWFKCFRGNIAIVECIDRLRVACFIKKNTIQCFSLQIQCFFIVFSIKKKTQIWQSNNFHSFNILFVYL